jgi:hypothetical protein
MMALKWINENREWLGGIAVVLTILAALWKFKRNKERAGVEQSLRSGDSSHNIQAGRDINISSAALGSDSAASSANVLKDLDHKMSDVFGPLRNWLKEHPFGHEFYVVSSTGVVLWNASQPRPRLNADEIPDLIAKVKLLEDHGFIRDVTPGNTKIYRLSPSFVAYLITQR